MITAHFISLSSCSAGISESHETNTCNIPDSILNEIQFDGHTYLNITVEDRSDTLNLSVRSLLWFPRSFFTVDTIISEFSNEIILSLDCQTPQELQLLVNNKSYNVFAVPSDTTHISITSADFILPENGMKVINEYILWRDSVNKQLGISNYTYANQIASAAISLAEHANWRDSMTAIELHSLQQYPKALPGWYQTREQGRISFGAASAKLIAPSKREYSGITSDSVQTGYYDFTNDSALWSLAIPTLIEYQSFLHHYVSTNMHYISDSDTAISEFCLKFYKYCLLQNITTGESLDIAILQEMIGYEQYQIIRERAYEYLVAVGNPFSSNKFYDYYLANSLNFKGPNLTNAPDFNALTPDKAIASLRDYKGKLVYISFWFTACLPCIHEFPSENELVNSYNSNDIVFLSVCVNSEWNTWQSVLAKNELNTISLFANEEQSKLLTTAYALNSFPRHVLIGQEGQIVNFYAGSPIEIQAEIDSLLTGQ